MKDCRICASLWWLTAGGSRWVKGEIRVGQGRGKGESRVSDEGLPDLREAVVVDGVVRVGPASLEPCPLPVVQEAVPVGPPVPPGVSQPHKHVGEVVLVAVALHRLKWGKAAANRREIDKLVTNIEFRGTSQPPDQHSH